MLVRAQQLGRLVPETLCHVEPAVPAHQAQGPKHLLLKLAAEAAAVAVSPNPQPCHEHSRMGHSLATLLSSQAETSEVLLSLTWEPGEWTDHCHGSPTWSARWLKRCKAKA